MLSALRVCYFVTVTPRHAVLAVVAVLVLGMAVYLFVQVRATPAQAQVVTPPPRAAAATPPPSGTVPPPAVPDRGAMSGLSKPIPGLHGDVPDKPAIAAAGDAPAATDEVANPRLDAVMEQANKAYDRQDFDEARAIAGKVLSKEPKNIRMLRIMVSSSCIEGDSVVAQKYYEQLPKSDRDQMRMRCDRYGVAFKEPAQ
jgi:hypothetical protein